MRQFYWYIGILFMLFIIGCGMWTHFAEEPQGNGEEAIRSRSGTGVETPRYFPSLIFKGYSSPPTGAENWHFYLDDGSNTASGEPGFRIYTGSWIDENASGGGGGAPTDATYLTQTENGTLTNEQAFANLSSGLLKVTTGTGVVETATAGSDYIVTETDPNALLTAGSDNVKDTHIDWGTGASQVSGADLPDEDVGDVTIATGVWAVEDDSHDHTTTITGKAANVSDADFGDVTVTSGAWGIDADAIVEPDLSVDNSPTDADILTYDETGTNFAWISQNAGTDITADLEEETHASEHAVSGTDTVFPADPGADKYLMWDDDPGQLSWGDAGGIAIGGAVGSGTSGSVLFVDASTQLAQDNAAFFWLAASDYLGLSTTGPDRRLDSLDTSGWQFRLTYTDDSVYSDFGTSAAGDFYLRPTGEQVFLGTGSGGSSQTTANKNVALGANTLDALTSGAENVAIGNDSLTSLNTGDSNVAIGDKSLYTTQGGTENVGLGERSLYSNVAGQGNMAIGYRSLYNSTANYNVGIGRQAFFTLTGASNVGIGTNVGYYANGTGNTNLGYQAGYGYSGQAIANYNVIVGMSAGYYGSDGDENTMVGYRAGFGTSGQVADKNIFVGSKAGEGISSGDNNIAIGYDVDPQSATASNQMTIGNLLFSNGIDGTGTTVSTGNLGVGVTSPDTKLDVNGALTLREKSADPNDPDEGSMAIWMSDGTGSGDDGDIMVKITAGGSTKTITLIDFSAF